MYEFTTFYLSTCQFMDTSVASVFLAIMKNAAVKICLCFCVDIRFYFSWVYNQVHMVTLYLTFWEIAWLFPQWLYLYTFPRALYVSSIFSIFSPELFSMCPFDYSHACGCEVQHFYISFCVIYLFLFFRFNEPVSLYLKWVSCSQHIVGSFFVFNLFWISIL